MDNALIAVAVIAAIASGLYALDRLGLWLEVRGWLYYRNKRGSGSLGLAVLETQALFDPGKQHVLEATQTKPDQEDSGDRPPPVE